MPPVRGLGAGDEAVGMLLVPAAPAPPGLNTIAALPGTWHRSQIQCEYLVELQTKAPTSAFTFK